jgi:transposase
MKIDANSLPNDPEQLKKMLLELQASTTRALAEKDKELAKQHEIIHGLLERYELARRKAFGKSSEQNPGSGETFNEAEETLDDADKALLAEVDSKKTPTIKNKPKRKPLPKDLPRKVVTIDLSVDEQVCDCCQSRLHKIGESRSEKLEFVPAHIKVIEQFALNTLVNSARKQVPQIRLKPRQCLQPPFPRVLPQQAYSANLSRENTNMAYRFIDKKVCLMTME